jgi:8-oxo-dGTP pyrophosphatase MutT (NUDIX family)
MINYCTGLMFNERIDRVVLIEKNRGPSHNIGRWNGVGGKVKPGEWANEAMQREFREEAGLDSPNWEHFATSYNDHHSLSWFRLFVPNPEIYMVKTKESEHVAVCPFDTLDQRPLAVNLEVMMTLALTPTIAFSKIKVDV